METFIFVIYSLIGVAFWSFYGIGLVKSEKRMQLQRQPLDLVPAPEPLVTILVPAKDEQERIGACIESILRQDYPNFNVVAVDDRSKDQTGAILDEIAAKDLRLKVVHLHEGDLPPNWSGKNYALHTASRRTQGTWLLFVDADVILYPKALPTALGIAMMRRYDLVSLMPRMEFHSFWEGVVTPLGAMATAMIHLASLTNTVNHPNIAFANGQFMLFDRRAYDQIGGHERVKDVLGEDTALARLMKRSGMRPRVSWGTDLCQVRMYDSLPKILRGWGRVMFAAAESVWRNVIGLLGTLILCYSVIPAAAWGIYLAVHHNPKHGADFWLTAAGLHWVLMTTMLCAMYGMARTRRWYGIVFLPLSGPLLIYMQLRAIYLGVSKRVEWRGTKYSGAATTVSDKQSSGTIA